MNYRTVFYLFLAWNISERSQCEAQTGPDPWNYVDKDYSSEVGDENIPPDLKIYPKKTEKPDNNYGMGEWFYRRLLAIVLKGGEVKNEDGSVDISLHMKLDQNQWNTLDEYLCSATPLSEDKLRRSLGHIEQSIYEPSLPTKIILAWSDHIQIFFTEYKSEITWTSALLAVSGLVFWMWTHMSHRQAVILLLIFLYMYEVIVSYKEAEQTEVNNFMAAINQCQGLFGYFWSSKCEVPKPDPLIFFKHMNPLKIGLRMFTTIVSEPMIALSATVKTMSHGITDGLSYPLDAILYGILVTFFNVLLLFFLIMIVFNFILNIPFMFNVFGILSFGLLQRKRNVFGEESNQNQQPAPRVIEDNNANVNAIDNNVVHKLLDIVAQVVNNRPNVQQNAVGYRPNNGEHNNAEFRAINVPKIVKADSTPGLRKSASTGRLTDLRKYEEPQDNLRRRNIPFNIQGGGDAR